MTRGRKPINTKIQPTTTVAPSSSGFLEPEAEMRQVTEAAEINAHALAAKLGYDGSLSVGSLEDEIRFFQRRSVEAVLELGKRLLILRELTPHGEFQQRIELLGISSRMGQRFMSATLKFSNAASTPLLKATGNQTKLLELLVLDDGEIKVLQTGGTARGLTIDKIDSMTVTELREALREAKSTEEAHEKLISVKDKIANDMAKRLEKAERRIETEAVDETLAGLRRELTGIAVSCEAEIVGKLGPAFNALMAHHKDHGGDSWDVMEGILTQIERRLAGVRGDCGLIGKIIAP